MKLGLQALNSGETQEMGGEEDSAATTTNHVSGGRKTLWRSASWSTCRTPSQTGHAIDCSSDSAEKGAPNGQFRCFPVPPLSPRSQQNCKARSCLPPLQPLSIARRSLDEWPRAGSDDIGEWSQPPTPSGKLDPKLDLSPFRTRVKRDQIACFDKECSKVADHIYLGGDAVARNREILRQNGITHVLNCVGFICPEYFKSDLVYKTLWLKDSPTEDITSILYDVFDYFEDVREQSGRVLVHCFQGVSRSTSLVIAYLMWSRGKSFDDAFQFVKAARGIANPNMGFTCQLLQCQKRVHSIPPSPNSVLRMYRMAPHSPYDPLHLVPKMLNDPLPSALDSRGAFIVHVLSSIYLWIGKECEPVMEKDAKAAAFQVVRYERVRGPIVTVEEGEEPVDFWDAFSNLPLTSDPTMKVSEDHVGSKIKIGVGKRKVETYDSDFELLYKAITGGVVPPFSAPGAGHETHLPARESNWSLLRRKFFTGGMKEWVSASKVAMCRVYSDSLLMRDTDCRANRVPFSSADSSTSPPYLSPSSLSSDSSSSSKSSLESPSDSPSTSSPSLTLSPALSNYSDSSLQSCRPSHYLSYSVEPGTLCLKAVSSPSKGFASSLAERRGGFSPSLKLPTLTNKSSRPSRRMTNVTSVSHVNAEVGLMKNNTHHTFDNPSSIGNISGFKCVQQSTADSFETCHPSECCIFQEDQVLSCLTKLTDSGSELSNTVHPLAYRWPDMEKIAAFGRDNLDSKAVFLFLAPNKGSGQPNPRVLYLWIGSCFTHANGWKQPDSGREIYELEEIDWNQVGSDFLKSMGLPKDIPIKVVGEEEPEEFLELLNSC